jgi:hypothetical protein
MNQRSLGGIGRAFSNRNFRVYTMGSAVSLIGTWLQKTAVGWTAWELTHDPTWVGIGSGGWDHEGRPSWVRLDRVLEVPEEGIRREGAIMERHMFELVAGRLRAEYSWS